jgi:hypothetical protein
LHAHLLSRWRLVTDEGHLQAHVGGATGKAGEKVRARRKPPVRKRHLVRG